MSPVDNVVLDLLDDGPGTIDEIAGSTDVHRNTVRNSIKRLLSQGLVEEIGEIRPETGRPAKIWAMAKTKPSTKESPQILRNGGFHCIIDAVVRSVSGSS